MKVCVTKAYQLDLLRAIRESPVAAMPDAEATMRDCLGRSADVWFGLVDGVLVCMWGLCPPTILSSSAWLWLFTINILPEHKFLFVRHSQLWVARMLDLYPEITGDMVEGGPKRWLKWLGAEFGPPEGQRIPFVIKRRVLHG